MGIRALLNDWGILAEVRVNSPAAVAICTDSSAAKGMSDRIGLGKVRHVQTRYLWIQERVVAKDLAIIKIKGVDNPSDILTKAVSADTIEKHMRKLSQIFRHGRAEGAKEVLASHTDRG